MEEEEEDESVEAADESFGIIFISSL